MAEYEDIKRNIEFIKTNKIGDRLLSIVNIATHFDYTVKEVKPVVQELISEGKLRFRRPVNERMEMLYAKELLEVVKQRKIIRKDNSWLYK